MVNINTNDIIIRLREQLSSKRLEHSINVMNTAVSLAKHYQADEQKAELAGILHDCAKELLKEESTKRAYEYGLEPDEIIRRQNSLLHGPLGAYIARNEFAVEDEEVFNAIYYHTTGRRSMSLLEKIVYISDYIEPGRTFKGVNVLRKLAFTNIDKCLLKCTDTTIRFILKEGGLLHPNTVDARNSVLKLF